MPDTSSTAIDNRPPAWWKGQSLGSLLERSGVPLFLLALVILFSFNPSTGEQFRSAANVQNIFANQGVVGLIAIAMVIPLVAGYFDLQPAAVAGLSNVAFAAISGTHQQPVIVGIVGALLIAVLAGAATGALVAYLRLSPFICTFGTYVLIGGLLQLYTEGQTIGGDLPASVGAWGSEQWFGIAKPFWLLLIVAILAWYMLTQTPFGRKLAAIGSNEAGARLAGIRAERAVFITFLLSGLVAGIAGVLLTSRSGGADATTATSYVFPAIAAVFLGQTAIRPGVPNVWGTMFGVFLAAVAVNGLTFLGAQAWVQQVFSGAALLFSVTFVTIMARVRERRARSAVLQAQAEQSSESSGPSATAGVRTGT